MISVARISIDDTTQSVMVKASSHIIPEFISDVLKTNSIYVAMHGSMKHPFCTTLPFLTIISSSEIPLPGILMFSTSCAVFFEVRPICQPTAPGP